MSLDEQDKQWILEQLRATQQHVADLITSTKESLEREFRQNMDRHFADLDKSISRHDKGILAANIGVNGVTEAQAKQEKQIRDILRRVDVLERKAKKAK